MRYIYLLLFALFSFAAFGQFKLKQLEPCKDQAGNRVDSCFTMTDAEGFQYYISYNDLINVVKNGGGSFTCDSVAACIQNSGILCSALLQIPSGAIASGDYLFGKNGSNCKKILLDSIISQNNLCSKLAFPVTTVSNSDYFLIKKANGDCRRVLASGIVGKVNCDSVEACLASGSLCDVLRGFSNGSPANGDSIIFIKNGTCRKGLINSLIGGMYNCDSVKSCIGKGTWFCDSVESCLKDGSLCAGLRSFASGTYQSGDSIWFSHNGVCRKGLIDDLIGGGGSLNCDSVKSCLSQGALCDAIGDLDVDGGGNTWYLLGRNSDGDCARIPWDSISAACKVSLEAAEFGGNSDGCEFATTCDGGNSYSNIFWLDFTTTGTKLNLNANAQGGGQNCKMTDIDLPLTVTNQSACTNGGVNLKFSVAWMGSTTNVDLGTIKLVQQGTLIKLLYNDVQCGSSACGVSCNPFTAPTDNVASTKDYPTINKVDLKKLKRYKNHVLADEDKSLPSGGLYLVGTSRSIQVKL